MRFVSFFQDKEESMTYSYHRRGVDQSYHPDLQKEDDELRVYDQSSGALFHSKPVSWKGECLLDMAVDIHIDFGKKLFADHIEIIQIEESAFSSIEIFDITEGHFKKIGVYTAETNTCVASKKIFISLGVSCRTIAIRINGCFRNFGIENLSIMGVEDIDSAVYPIPENCTLNDGDFFISKGTAISASDENAVFAAGYMANTIKDKYGISLSVNNSGGQIRFESVTRCDDGYEISVTREKCTVKSCTKLGFLYAVCVLVERFNGNRITCMEITDKPFLNLRGVHLALPERKNIPFFKSLIKNIFIPMRYNTVFLQFSGAMQYDAFPEIADRWLTSCRDYESGSGLRPAHYEFVGHEVLAKEEVRDLCDYIKSFGFELIPEIQSWGHTQYITSAYPELGEREDASNNGVNLYKADAKLQTGAPHCMCPCHKDYYDVTFTIANEIIDVAKPQRYVHMGHDEIYHVALCDKCRKIGAAKLYAKEVTCLNDFIKSKGLTMMIWADMLQEEDYDTRFAIDDVPKDIIMLDFTWYFHPEADIEDNLLKHGFKVVFGNLYSSHYPRYEFRSRKEGVIGAEISTWVYCDEKTYAFEGKMYELVYGANLIWDSSYNSSMRLSYNEIIKPFLWKLRKDFGSLKYSVSNALEIEKTCCDSDVSLNYAICSPDKAEIGFDISENAKLVSILWATDKNDRRVMWEDPFSIGTLTAIFEDGSRYSEDILYALNIFSKRSVYAKPTPSFLFRHEGYIGTYYTKPHQLKANDGTDCTLGEHFIKIPQGKRLKRLSVTHSCNTDSNICIYGVNYHC